MTGRLAVLLLLVALALAAALAWRVTGEHFDDRDRALAVRAVRVHRFGSSTRARISGWLSHRRAGRPVRWSAELESRAGRQVLVRLEIDGAEAYRWHVHLPDHQVEPADDATRALVAEIATLARE